MKTAEHERNLALALVQALRMWSDQHYQPFLHSDKPGELKEDWFRWFVGAWGVARTIKNGRQASVRKYLDRDFRKALLKGGEAEAVEAAGQYIQQRGWGSRLRKDGNSSSVISLVSKVGFFLHPAKLVPLDNYAVKGLNALRRIEGGRKLKGGSYREYLEAFNEHYRRMEPQLQYALQERWVADLADRLGCPIAALSQIAMRRKLFDDYLMHTGGYRQ